ncbi:type II secretion system protein [Photobacterium nomapromontoriensis]|uniref:type II secretion system protein n=1 Tax=Photobacterium nomapromontoriensis TaxID=2910237 RepID=UPI003D12A5BC
MKRQQGFTLIELVIVIVILGILAVVAAPRFMNLQSDAKYAALNGMKGAIHSAIDSTYGKLALLGLENKDRVCDAAVASKDCENTDLGIPGCDDTFCLFEYGYPSDDGVTIAHLVNGIAVNNSHSDDDFVAFYSVKHQKMVITFSNNVVVETSGGQVTGHHLLHDRCYITYEKADKENSQPTISNPINCK